MVVDASMIAAISFAEPEATLAQQTLAGTDLHAPTLLYYELTNIARSKAVSMPDRFPQLLLELQVGLNMSIRLHVVSFTEVLHLAVETGLTAYDAAYLHLAQTLGTSLATFDKALRTAAQGRVPLA